MAEVHIVGWDDAYRWEEERRRVMECVKAIAEQNGFAFALVEDEQCTGKRGEPLNCCRDMRMRIRYRGGSNYMNVRFRRKYWVLEQRETYVPARLYFNEDCDLATNKIPNPEWFEEVKKKDS